MVTRVCVAFTFSRDYTFVLCRVFQGNPLPRTFSQEYKFVLHEHPSYQWTPRLTSREFMSMLADLDSIRIRATYTAGGKCICTSVVHLHC